MHRIPISNLERAAALPPIRVFLPTNVINDLSVGDKVICTESDKPDRVGSVLQVARFQNEVTIKVQPEVASKKTLKGPKKRKIMSLIKTLKKNIDKNQTSSNPFVFFSTIFFIMGSFIGGVLLLTIGLYYGIPFAIQHAPYLVWIVPIGLFLTGMWIAFSDHGES